MNGKLFNNYHNPGAPPENKRRTKTMKTEFIAEYNTMHLYVDGCRTNTWYFLPEYKFYDLSPDTNNKQRRIAEVVKSLIDTGNISTDNWHDWDICDYHKYHMGTLEILKEDEVIAHENEILCCRGYENYSLPEIQAVIIRQCTDKVEYVQWCKRIIGNSLSNRVGIKFYPYGYVIGFLSDNA